MKIHAINTSDGYHSSYDNIKDFIIAFNNDYINSETVYLFTEEQKKEMNEMKQQIKEKK